MVVVNLCENIDRRRRHRQAGAEHRQAQDVTHLLKDRVWTTPVPPPST
jgi:hypothetical protein